MAPSSIILPSDNFDDLFEEDDLFGGYGGAFPAIPEPVIAPTLVPIVTPAPATIPTAGAAIVPPPVRAYTLNLLTAPITYLPTAPIFDPAPAPIAAPPAAAPIRRRRIPRTSNPTANPASNPAPNPLAPAPTGVAKGRARKNSEITQRERKTLVRGIQNQRTGKGASKSQQEMLDKYPDLSRRLRADPASLDPPTPPAPQATPSLTPPNAVAPPDIVFASWDDMVLETARIAPFPYPGAQYHAPEADFPAPAFPAPAGPQAPPGPFAPLAPPPAPYVDLCPFEGWGEEGFDYLHLPPPSPAPAPASAFFSPPFPPPFPAPAPGSLLTWGQATGPENYAPGAYQSAGQTMIRTHKMQSKRRDDIS